MSKEKKVRIIILAAGKGTRMESSFPKVLVQLKGQHMIRHLLDSIEKTKIDPRPIIVVGYEKELIIKELGDKYEYVIQKEQLGTGHAVYVTQSVCKNTDHIIVISGDQPFIKTETIKKLFTKHLTSGAKITITTTEVADFEDWRKPFLRFGRILRKNGKIIDKEFRDANDEERKIKELNVSCYAFNAKWIWDNFAKIDKNKNVQKEYLLTDLWQIAGENGEKVETITIEPLEALGVNSKEELEILEKIIV